MKDILLHYMPIYAEYVRYFGSSFPHMKVTHLPHEAQQQLHFIYLLQMAKNAGVINLDTYYVPLAINSNFVCGADGLIIDNCISKVVSVQHKYFTAYNHYTITLIK